VLETIRIQNYALIDAVEIDLGKGFNVLTGETGAGKSILIGALGLVLGARVAGGVVRQGAQRASIEAVFSLADPSPRLQAILDENGIDLDDGELLLARTITAEGRSRAYAGGALVPLNVLARIGDELVDLHGQHEHQSLLKADRQMDLVDAFGNLGALLGKVGELVATLHGLERTIAALESDDREQARTVEFLKHEIGEIDGASLEPGEETDLRSRRTLVANAEKITEAALRAYAALYEGDGEAAFDKVAEAANAVEELAAMDEQFQPLASQLGEIRESIVAVADEVRGYGERPEFDAEELNALNQRLSLLGDLKRKYGDTVEVILAYRDDAQKKVEDFEQRDTRLAEYHAQADAVRKDAMVAAESLSKKRKAAARKLVKGVTVALQDLGMKGATFEIAIEAADLTATGIDRLEFMLAANKGEPLKPLKQVASGGEISRIMLALKATSAQADAIPTLIFDEVDAGVGGAVANQLAEKIGELAASHQILCITHLPQIAAVADLHFHVSKQVEKDRTITLVTCVEHESRVKEVARLLDGSLTDVSLEHARSLLG
jgi:DNA repair protein RecN (Recombination protein N)